MSGIAADARNLLLALLGRSSGIAVTPPFSKIPNGEPFTDNKGSPFFGSLTVFGVTPTIKPPSVDGVVTLD